MTSKEPTADEQDVTMTVWFRWGKDGEKIPTGQDEPRPGDWGERVTLRGGRVVSSEFIQVSDPQERAEESGKKFLAETWDETDPVASDGDDLFAQAAPEKQVGWTEEEEAAVWRED